MSTKGKLTKDDLVSVGKGAGIAAAGAAATYVIQWAMNADFGTWTPIVVSMLSIGVNLLRKWGFDTKAKQTDGE